MPTPGPNTSQTAAEAVDLLTAYLTSPTAAHPDPTDPRTNLDALVSAQVAALTTAQLALLTTTQVATLGTAQVASLTSSQIASRTMVADDITRQPAALTRLTNAWSGRP